MEPLLALTDRWEPKSNEIAAKVIDGEAIIINLTNGYYYSMDGIGAVVWEAVQRRCSLDAMAKTVSCRYLVSFDAAASDIRLLMAQLAHEELVTPANGHTGQPMLEEPQRSPQLPYKPPILEKYGDMAHFFAVDPPLPELDENSTGTEPS